MTTDKIYPPLIRKQTKVTQCSRCGAVLGVLTIPDKCPECGANLKERSEMKEQDKEIQLIEKCTHCTDCIYLGEGDFLCRRNRKIILTDFTMPTKAFGNCKRLKERKK